MATAELRPGPIRDARAQILERWSQRTGGPREGRDEGRRAALLDRLLEAIGAPERARAAPEPCRTVGSVAETADTIRELFQLAAVVREMGSARAGPPVDPVELTALGGVVEDAIASHLGALEAGPQRALARDEITVPEEGSAPDEIDYVWDIGSDVMQWEDRRVGRTVPIADDLGHSRAEFLAHLHRDDRERVARTAREAIERGDELYWSEYRMRRDGGVWADVMDRAVLVREGRRVIRAIGHIRERTMVRRLIRELEETQERLRDAADAGDVGTFRIDLESHISVRDGTLNRILGGEAETTTQLQGDVLGWIHPSDREGVRRELDRVAREGGSFSIDGRVATRDGSTRWIRGKGRTLLGVGGRPRWVTGAVVDVTAERVLAEERERLLDDARSARAQAEAANRAKEDFLALVSHELRAPLSAILGWLSLLRSGSLDAERSARALTIVERNAQAQLRLVEDLLDMSRVLAGKLALDMGLVDLAALAADVVQSWRPAAIAKAIDLEASVGPDSATVLGDAERLRQAVSNLVGNAIKFTPTGGRVEVAVARGDDLARLTVRDTGRGIPADQLTRIFERFHQVGVTGARTSGLGLGLPLVKDIVELHGGTVRPESVEGVGTTMAVELPLRESR